MTHLVYLLVLAACLLGTLPLELHLGVRVYARWRPLLATVAPVVLVFGGIDSYAVHAGLWSYNSRYLIGVTVVGRLPLEEVLFFAVIPICAVLTFEAVLVRRPDWVR